MEEAPEDGRNSYSGNFVIQALPSLASMSTQTEDVFKKPLAFKTPLPASTMRISTPNGPFDLEMCASPHDLSPIERWNKSGLRDASTSFETSMGFSSTPYVLSSPEIGFSSRREASSEECSKNYWESTASSSGYHSHPGSYFSLDNSCGLPQSDRKDILRALYRTGNYSHIISHILSYLSPQDLAHSQLVSKTWNRLVQEDSEARLRLATYHQDKLHAENFELDVSLKLRRGNLRRSAFSDISNESLHPPSPTKDHPTYLTNFEKFLKERNNCAPGESLRRCPKCQSPSHVTRRTAKCTQCKLDFCLVCYMDRTTSFHDTMCRSETQRIASPTKVVSKSSKRRLRRLVSLKL